MSSVPGERWGVDAKTIVGTNEGRALGSVFGGVHVNPNVDVFAGGTYSTQENYQDGTGYEVANTGNRLSAGIGKITVRPADGHEVKLGAIYQEDLYSVGQPPRRAGDPNSTNPNGTNSLGGTSIYKTNLQNYTTTRRLEILEARRQAVRLGRQGLLEPDGQRPDKDVPYQHDAERAYCGPGIPGNAVSGCIGSRRGYLLDTVGFDVHNTSRFEVGDWRNAITYGVDAFQDKVITNDTSGTSEITTPGGRRTVSGGFVQWKANYSTLLEIGQRASLRQLQAGIRQRRRRAATGCRRRSRSA